MKTQNKYRLVYCRQKEKEMGFQVISTLFFLYLTFVMVVVQVSSEMGSIKQLENS